MVENRLHWAVNDPGQWESARRIGEQCGACVPVHLHVDTGMSRLGLSPAQVGGVLEKFRSTKSVQLVGVMSHLATAHTDGALDEVQRQRFETLLGNHERLREPDVIKHLAATAGACR
ncbi:MAG: alanine racemase, partial [Phycisphaerales bacterium]|nr:alanine racemase [Phycisphaerales bacterium]